MKKSLIIICAFVLLISCIDSISHATLKVETKEELQKAIQVAQAGDEIILANRIWNNLEIQFTGKGTKQKPIVLRAETPGMVILEGQSSLKFGGEYLVASGLTFKNGYSPSSAVVAFKIDDSVANNCRLTASVIKDFTQLNRYETDHWVDLWGRNNRLDHCYMVGKSNKGPTIVVNLDGNENSRNHHQIVNNHFGPRPRKGGPSGETIRIGNSSTSMVPSHVNVSNNFFEKCNGEVEIISSKSNFNEFRNNIFYECEGSLVLRHGNYNLVDGNYFIGNDKPFMGGIRVINSGHWITNNYFYKVRGEAFRSPLAIMNGIPKSPMNRYNQVTDVVVAHNTWIDCKSPWQFSVGANMNKAEILPKQEIRSARPLRTLLANNIIYNSQADEHPIINYDTIDGVIFKNNIIDNQDMNVDTYDGIEFKELELEKISEALYIPSKEQKHDLEAVYKGFGFERITEDIFKNSRQDHNLIGAISGTVTGGKGIVNRSKFGPAWYKEKEPRKAVEISIAACDVGLGNEIAKANDGDILILDCNGIYYIGESLKIDKNITIKSSDKEKKPKLIFSGKANSPMFQLNPKGNLTLKGVVLDGEFEQLAFATLEKNMSGTYGLVVENSIIKGFGYVLKGFKGSFANTISFSETLMKNCLNGIELAAELDDNGDYNAEFVHINNCTMEHIEKNVINFYRGGYDESTIGGNLLVQNSSFTKCGTNEKTGILLNTRGIVNVDLRGNTFQSNPVKYIAVLWGEKNNKHHGNKIDRSGTLRIDQYLKQKLMY